MLLKSGAVELWRSVKTLRMLEEDRGVQIKTTNSLGSFRGEREMS